MSCETLQPLSAFYGTNLSNQIDGYSRLADRISYSLGYPMVNIEIHRNQLYEFISIASEMFTKFAGYTQEYLVFDSNLYESGKGVRLDKLFDLTTEISSEYNTADTSVSETHTRQLTTTIGAGNSAVVYDFDISDATLDPAEFGLRFIDTTTKHQRVSKMLVTTQFLNNSGNAAFTEYGVVHTTGTDFASFSVQLSGVSGQRATIVCTPTVSGDAVVVATDTYTSTLQTITGQQTEIRNIDTLLNKSRRVIEVTNFNEGSNTGVNTLFTIEQTLAQQTYFSYSMGNYGFDLISWYTVKEFLETREKLLTVNRSYKFDQRTQYLTLYPQPLSGTSRFYGIVPCYVERPLAEVIKEPWVYQYALALTKIGVGRVRGKFNGTTLLGGGQINYQDILNEGIAEKRDLEDKLYNGAPGLGDADPPQFFVG